MTKAEAAGLKVLILVPCWGRPEILKLCLTNLAWFEKQVSWQVETLLVLSPEDEHINELLKIANAFKVQICFYKNYPVGTKMNAAIRYANQFDFDYLMNFGSDDIIHPRIEKLYAAYLQNGEMFFGINNLYFYDYIDSEAYFFKSYNLEFPIGAGRMIHKKIIHWFITQKMYLYEPEKNMGLDSSSMLTIHRYTQWRARMVDCGTFPYLVDIKTLTNINPMITLKNRTDVITKTDKEMITNFYPLWK